MLAEQKFSQAALRPFSFALRSAVPLKFKCPGEREPQRDETRITHTGRRAVRRSVARRFKGPGRPRVREPFAVATGACRLRAFYSDRIEGRSDSGSMFLWFRSSSLRPVLPVLSSFFFCSSPTQKRIRACMGHRKIHRKWEVSGPRKKRDALLVRSLNTRCKDRMGNRGQDEALLCAPAVLFLVALTNF